MFGYNEITTTARNALKDPLTKLQPEVLNRACFLAQLAYELNPQTAPSHHVMALAYDQRDRGMESLVHFETAIEFQDLNPQIRADYAEALLKLEMPRMAIKHIDHARMLNALEPEFDYIKAKIYEHLAKGNHSNNNLAMKSYRDAKRKLNMIGPLSQHQKNLLEEVNLSLEDLTGSDTMPDMSASRIQTFMDSLFRKNQ